MARQVREATSFPTKEAFHLLHVCDSAMGHSQVLPALKTADFGLFGATWWPEASWERLRIATYLAAWVCA